MRCTNLLAVLAGTIPSFVGCVAARAAGSSWTTSESVSETPPWPFAFVFE